VGDAAEQGHLSDVWESKRDADKSPVGTGEEHNPEAKENVVEKGQPTWEPTSDSQVGIVTF